MPYSGINDPDLPSNVKKMSDSDKKQWIATFEACLADGGTEGDCMKLANGVVKKEDKKGLLEKALQTLRDLFADKDRAISSNDLYMSIAYQGMDMSYSAWLIDVYYDQGQVFAIFAERGKLFQAGVITDSGSAVLAERETWTEVMAEFKPVSQFKITRDKDGKDRWFLLAGTTILNRNGQIDSEKLFDGMIEKCQSGAYEYPYLTYYHLKEQFAMGITDYVARDGVALIASGTFYDNDVAEAMKARVKENPEIWGSSISFMTENPRKVEVVPGIKLDVFEEGYLVEISILKEEDACALMTSLQVKEEVNRMNEQVKEALELLAGGDKDLLESFVSRVDQANKTVVEEGLIHRQADPAPATESVVEPVADPAPADPPKDPPPAEEDAGEDEIELNEEAVKRIAEAVSKTKAFSDLVEKVAQAVGSFEAVQKEVTDMHALQIQQQKKITEELAEIKRSDEEKQKALLEDMSSRQLNKTRVTFRPTLIPQDQQQAPKMADTASATLQNIK